MKAVKQSSLAVGMTALKAYPFCLLCYSDLAPSSLYPQPRVLVASEGYDVVTLTNMCMTEWMCP
jgi:hypothetical protein